MPKITNTVIVSPLLSYGVMPAWAFITIGSGGKQRRPGESPFGARAGFGLTGKAHLRSGARLDQPFMSLFKASMETQSVPLRPKTRQDRDRMAEGVSKPSIRSPDLRFRHSDVNRRMHIDRPFLTLHTFHMNFIHSSSSAALIKNTGMPMDMCMCMSAMRVGNYQ